MLFGMDMQDTIFKDTHLDRAFLLLLFSSCPFKQIIVSEGRWDGTENRTAYFCPTA